ncbi:MAG: alkyl hydroperoxide reductase/Thiol specific antioxidant/Mal allergen [Chlorobi bacterium]|nr:alkyl hydroperoxide reductase/Thiol specific antioxidant/Mal allergen [Chlorobiota bacterium]
MVPAILIALALAGSACNTPKSDPATRADSAQSERPLQGTPATGGGAEVKAIPSTSAGAAGVGGVASMDDESAPASGPGVGRVVSVEENVTATEGQMAPNFTWKGADGKEHSLKEYRGKVVLLNFWGTWCPPCRMELPDIVKLREKLGAKGFEVIGVNVAEEDRMQNHIQTVEQHVGEFATKNGLKYPLAIANDKVIEAYGGLEGVPTTFILNRKGEIIWKAVGMQREADFRGAIDKAM